jgi:hypothetical protein
VGLVYDLRELPAVMIASGWGVTDRSRRPLNPQDLAPLYILQNLEVEAHVEPTLSLFVLPFTEWSRGIYRS